MIFKINKLYKPVLRTKCRYIHIWGGRGRGASHFATDYFLWLITDDQYFRGGFIRSTFGEIKTGLYRAFKDRVVRAEADGEVEFSDFKFNDTELGVTYIPTGNSIISKGLKKSNLNQAANLKGLEGLTHLIIEEAEDSNEEDIDKLDDTLRTVLVDSIQIIFLFNPPHKGHYLIKRNYNLLPADAHDSVGNPVTGWYKATPKNNPELLSIHGNYTYNTKNLNESNKRKNYNYGDPASPYYNIDKYCRDVLGLVSEGKKGRIFQNVKPITIAQFNSLPYPSFYGLDFGFNDPNAVVELKYHDGKLFWNELIYESGLDNDELAAKMKSAKIDKSRKVYADSARPDNIKSLNKYGFIVIGADKGPGSIESGYRDLLDLEHYYTDNSKNLRQEFELHSWELDKDKEPTDVPEDDNNHLIDAGRYAYTKHIVKKSAIWGISS
jgi:phage terminase large subunit